jgi:hypothetical protein
MQGWRVRQCVWGGRLPDPQVPAFSAACARRCGWGALSDAGAAPSAWLGPGVAQAEDVEYDLAGGEQRNRQAITEGR